MPSSPLISLIIPSYNAEASMDRCLQSIANQSFPGFEVLIMDGLSSDNTLNRVRVFSEKDMRFRLISEKDHRIYDALNKGIEKATGKWLLFLGADDQLYDKNVFENMYGILNSSTVDMIYGNVKVVGEVIWAHEGDIYDGPFTVQKLFSKNICHQAIFYRKSLFKKIGLYNPDYKIAADWDLNHRCFAYGSVQYADQVISAFYAGGESSQINKKDLFSSRDIVLNLKKYYHIGYFSILYRPYSWVFYNIACDIFLKRSIPESLYFYSLPYSIQMGK